MDLAGVDRETAEKALAEHTEVWLAVDALLVKPIVGGEKYIPAKPAVNSGMTVEQKERCDRGRWLQDKVNVVFSVAHSQIRPQTGDLPEAESVDLPLLGDSEPAVSAPPSSPRDGREQTTPPS